jgi:hypothetical protein
MMLPPSLSPHQLSSQDAIPDLHAVRCVLTIYERVGLHLLAVLPNFPAYDLAFGDDSGYITPCLLVIILHSFVLMVPHAMGVDAAQISTFLSPPSNTSVLSFISKEKLLNFVACWEQLYRSFQTKVKAV